MDNCFEIPVTYNFKDYNFQAELIPYGYSYKIDVDVFGKIVSFERDEEQNFRAVVNYNDLLDAGDMNKALLQEISKKLIELFKR